ncbi:hypothetical protein [Streptomyces sp. NPDC090112]|uniref:hypothetical protein n=1 Tax=Streptomyces sp. NPDC090112 TaxID=3365949 RepID=UPI0038289749
MEVFPVVECVVVGDRSALPEAARVQMRGAAVDRLLALRREQKLTTGHVRVAAGELGVSERTVWRWLAAPVPGPGMVPGVRLARADRFVVTDEVRALLGLWRGNVAAVQRVLAERAGRQSPPGTARL